MKRTKQISVMLFCVLLLVSCTSTTSSYNTTITVDSEIDPALSAEVYSVYNASLSSLCDGGSPASVVSLPDMPYMPAYVEESGNVMAFSPEISLSDIVAGEGKVLSEIHIMFGKNVTTAQYIEVSAANGFAADFSFALEPYAKEMYLVLSAFSRGAIDYLVYSAFAKTDNGWKLYELRYDEYAFEDMDAAALFEKATELSSFKETVPAAVYAYCAGRVLTPCGIVSSDNDNIAAGIEPLVNAVNQKHRFPYELSLADDPKESEQVKENSKTTTLFGFEPVVTEQGIEVVVKYFTEIDLKDIVAARDADENAEPLPARQQAANEKTEGNLEDEAQLILEHIDRSFAGVTKTFSNAHMVVYNRFEVKPENDKKSGTATDAKQGKEYEYIFYIFKMPTTPEEETAI